MVFENIQRLTFNPISEFAYICQYEKEEDWVKTSETTTGYTFERREIIQLEVKLKEANDG